MTDVMLGAVKAISYWGYVVLTPGLIVATVLCLWLNPREK